VPARGTQGGCAAPQPVARRPMRSGCHRDQGLRQATAAGGQRREGDAGADRLRRGTGRPRAAGAGRRHGRRADRGGGFRRDHPAIREQCARLGASHPCARVAARPRASARQHALHARVVRVPREGHARLDPKGATALYLGSKTLFP